MQYVVADFDVDTDKVSGRMSPSISRPACPSFLIVYSVSGNSVALSYGI